MSTQLGVPVEITTRDVERKRSFGGSMILCAEAAGYDLDKQLRTDLGVDRAQFSRWHNDSEGILWPKLLRLMQICGNHAPVLWMLYQLGYDLDSLRKRETELEQKLRLEQEENDRLRHRLEVLEEFAGVRR